MAAEDLARQFLALTDARDLGTREALFTDDCEFVSPMGSLHGPAATTAFSQGMLADFTGAAHRIVAVVSDGDVAMVEGVWSATHAPTGRTIDLPFTATVQADGDRIGSIRLYFDPGAFAAQLTPPAAAVDNTVTVRRMFEEVINLGKLDVIDELFDPEFQTVTPMGTFDREGFKQFVAGWRAGFADVNCEVGDILAEGDKVAWSVRATGTNTGDFMGQPATGRSVDFLSLNTGEFRDGRAYRHTVLMDLGTMMAQLAGTGAGAAA